MKQECHLISVYGALNSYETLFDLLKERKKEQSISHQNMPEMSEHIKFVRSQPYHAWYLIEAHRMGPRVGAIYLTKQREVGIFIFRQFAGKGYGTAALRELRAFHPGPILANINPANKGSIEFFVKHGAKLLQHTYLIS